MDVRTDSANSRPAGDATVGSHASVVQWWPRLVEHQHLARQEDHGALLAVPARVRQSNGSGDAVTVEFTFDR